MPNMFAAFLCLLKRVTESLNSVILQPFCLDFDEVEHPETKKTQTDSRGSADEAYETEQDEPNKTRESEEDGPIDYLLVENKSRGSAYEAEEVDQGEEDIIPIVNNFEIKYESTADSLVTYDAESDSDSTSYSSDDLKSFYQPSAEDISPENIGNIYYKYRYSVSSSAADRIELKALQSRRKQEIDNMDLLDSMLYSSSNDDDIDENLLSPQRNTIAKEFVLVGGAVKEFESRSVIQVSTPCTNIVRIDKVGSNMFIDVVVETETECKTIRMDNMGCIYTNGEYSQYNYNFIESGSEILISYELSNTNGTRCTCFVMFEHNKKQKLVCQSKKVAIQFKHTVNPEDFLIKIVVGQYGGNGIYSLL